MDRARERRPLETRGGPRSTKPHRKRRAWALAEAATCPMAHHAVRTASGRLEGRMEQMA